MPEAAPIAKSEAVQALGATLHYVGHTVDDAVAAARARAGRQAWSSFTRSTMPT